MGSLPTPSNMTWEDVSKILHGSVPAGEDQTLIAETPSVQQVQELRKQLERLVENTSEIEATARVLLYVFEASWSLTDVRIKLQSSVSKHYLFTDFIFICGSEDKVMKSFIEVKRPEITTHMNMTVQSTAQAVREAHILLRRATSVATYRIPDIDAAAFINCDPHWDAAFI